MTPVRLEPGALRSRVKHSTTEPLRSHFISCSSVHVYYVCKDSHRLEKHLNLEDFLEKYLNIFKP